MNLDERIDKALGSMLFVGEKEYVRVTNPEVIKQLIRDVLEEVKPELLRPAGMPMDDKTLREVSPSMFIRTDERRKTLKQMEAKIKELGL